MRTLVWDGPDAMHVEEAPEPGDPGPGELILRPEAVGICGSEVEGYLGHMGNRIPPLVMGHEFAGTVVATGEGASELDGARVAVNPLSRLRRVPAVPRRASRTCARTACSSACTSPGAFAGFVKVRAADARVLPDGVSARVGALMEPLANGVHAVRLADRGVESAVVLGAGHDRARHAAGRAAGRHPPRRRRRAAGRAARARRRARRPRRLRHARGGQGRGRARPGARRGRRAGHPRARPRAAAPRRDAWSASASPPTTRRSASTA